MLRIILLLSPVYVTLFWAIVLSLNDRKSNIPKIFLAKVMMVAFVLYFSHFIYFLSLTKIYSYIDSIYTLASLSVYPLYYIYVLLLTSGERFSLKRHVTYLILPLVIFILVLIATLSMEVETRNHYFEYVLTGKAKPAGNQRFAYSVYIAGRIIFILQVFFYLFMVNREVSIHNNKIADYYSDLEERSLRWVRIFNISYFLASAGGVALAMLGRERFFENDTFLVFPSVVFSTLLFIISYLGNKQKPTGVGRQEQNLIIEELNENTSNKLSSDLITLFEKEQYYLNKDFKIWDVCAKIGSNRTYVSRVINLEFGVNFTTFVNNYRVEHAKKLLVENPSIPVEELADNAGFGSVNSLYRAFESKENVSLGVFRKNMK